MPDVLRQRDEPTRTRTLRGEYATAITKRFRRLKGLVRTTIVDNDAFGLRASLAEARDDFDFPTDAGKQSAFMQWFRQALHDDVLEELPDGRVRRGNHYTGSFARSAYQKGLRLAQQALARLGVDITVGTPLGESTSAATVEPLFNMPVHRDALELLYTRHYSALEGITDAVGKDVSRVLTESFVEGVGPREMARRINGQIDDIGINRARTLARSETINTHNQSALNRYEQSPVEKVEIIEVLDRRTCAECAAADGEIITIQEARSRTSAHANCRRAFGPVVETTSQ